MCTFIFFFIISVSYVNSDIICDVDTCKCNYENNVDYQGETVDCSYSHGAVLTQNHSLPDLVYALDLSWCKITNVESSTLLSSNSLTELFLRDNDIVEIKPNALQLPKLKRLDLSYNNLDAIDENVFKGLKNLQYLNLANNKFVTFNKLTFHHLSGLEEIVLDNNNIGPCLEKTELFDRNGFGLTEKIKNISISSINLNFVPDNFLIDAYDIRKLVISGNNITEIFELPFTLQYLDLSDNPIKEISMEDFSDSPSLRVLRLNNLLINEVPDYAFSSVKGLLKLEIERNKNLTYFSPLAFGHEVLDDPDDFVLETLSLRGSRLTTLDNKLIQPFGQLIQLDLQGNPWTCDCKLIWLKNLRIPAEDTQHLRCATPAPLYNSKVYALDTKYFLCQTQHKYITVIMAILFSLIFSIIALWLFLFLPKYQSRSRALQNLYLPATPYTVLSPP